VINDDTHHGVLAPRFAALVSVLLAAAACSNASPDDSSPSSDDTSMSAATVPPEAIENPEEAATAAYTRYWDTILSSFAAPDGDFSNLEAIASGQALEYAIAIEQRGLDESVYGTGEMTHDLEIKDALLEGDMQQVVVIDCADTTGTQVLNANGEPVAGEEYGAKEIQARAELLDGYWIITELAVQGIGSCVPDP
jgi:hypothetical protein